MDLLMPLRTGRGFLKNYPLQRLFGWLISGPHQGSLKINHGGPVTPIETPGLVPFLTLQADGCTQVHVLSAKPVKYTKALRDRDVADFTITYRL
jgi:hypothetical protein